MEKQHKNKSTKSTKTGNPPEVTFRDRDLAVKIWRNTTEKNGEEIEYRTATFERTYKDKDDKLQSTKNLRIQDMPRAALLLQKAYEQQRIKETTNGTEEITAESDDSQE